MENKAQADQVIKDFLDAYLIEGNTEKALQYVSDSVIGIGSRMLNAAMDKIQMKDFMSRENPEELRKMQYTLNHSLLRVLNENTYYYYGRLAFDLDSSGSFHTSPQHISAVLTRKEEQLTISAIHFSGNRTSMEGLAEQIQLETLAYIDPVTSGANRLRFEQEVKNILDTTDEKYVVIYTNVEKFKLINDRLGRKKADYILKQMYNFFVAGLKENELTARLNADNFGILLKFDSMQNTEKRLRSFCEQMKNMKSCDGLSFSIALTFGIYIVDDKNEEVVDMLDSANLARRHIVRHNNLSYGLYSHRIKDQMVKEKMLEDRMTEALEREEFIVYLQPKFELESNSIVGAEALIRWQDPKEGLILPGTFIPLFEKNGFIVQIDLYVFKAVCRMLRKWLDAGLTPVPVSVNLSRANLEIPGFLKSYQLLLQKYEVPAKYIEFEFTETLVYDNLPVLTKIVSEIHEMGCLCSMDDFGSGYSSLNLLKSIFVDILKIDRVFFDVPGEESERSRNVIRGVIALAKSLKLKTVSEGIESHDQVAFLKQVGCDMIQGFVYAKPMPQEEFEMLYFGCKITAQKKEMRI